MTADAVPILTALNDSAAVMMSNSPTVGNFNITAAATSTVVTDANVHLTDRVLVTPGDAAAAQVMFAPDAPMRVTPAAGSFTVSHISQGSTLLCYYTVVRSERFFVADRAIGYFTVSHAAALGTEEFSYVILGA
jgi:hypothetical protein